MDWKNESVSFDCANENDNELKNAGGWDKDNTAGYANTNDINDIF
jgi:hypothetical protein